MSHDPSRKHFFAKLLGLIAAASYVPKLLAKPSAAAQSPGAPTVAFKIQPAPHTVARRDGPV